MIKNNSVGNKAPKLYSFGTWCDSSHLVPTKIAQLEKFSLIPKDFKTFRLGIRALIFSTFVHSLSEFK